GSQISNLNLAGGLLLLGSASQIGNLSLSSGELGGSGNLTVTGAFTWIAGTLSVSQTTAQSGIDFHGDHDAFLSGMLTNPVGQTTTLGASGNIALHLQNGAVFVNAGTFTGSGDGQIAGDAGGGNTFRNAGTFDVAEAPGHTFNLGSGFRSEERRVGKEWGATLTVNSLETVRGQAAVDTGQAL